jgi:geranylgeranyl diphosphate synthase type II
MQLQKALADFAAEYNRQTTEFIPGQPDLLYAPVRYISTLPSKKLRPFLVYTFASGFRHAHGEATIEATWRVAAAIEMLHNFTLIHDDIMDNDDWRRGRETVHKKWDTPTAILSGDGLLALAIDILAQTESPRALAIIQSFAEAVRVVCEGQALDKEFESRVNVGETEYLDMISKKTSSLIASSCYMGAQLGLADSEALALVQQYGLHLGLAFQLQDDYLDIFAEAEDLGKDIGSDLRLHKKTLIMIQLMQQPELLARIDTLVKREPVPLDEIRNIIEESGIGAALRNEVTRYTQAAKKILDDLRIAREEKDLLWQLADYLEQRTH